MRPKREPSVSIDSVANEEVALASAWRLQRTGNFVAAFDLAQDALRRWPGSQALEHVSILALASCGSTQAALDAFRATSLSMKWSWRRVTRRITREERWKTGWSGIHGSPRRSQLLLVLVE